MPVIQKLDSAIHRINHYPVENYQGKQLRYLVDRTSSGGWGYPPFKPLGPDGQSSQSLYLHSLFQALR